VASAVSLAPALLSSTHVNMCVFVYVCIWIRDFFTVRAFIDVCMSVRETMGLFVCLNSCVSMCLR
jgi:hypothetical protein